MNNKKFLAFGVIIIFIGLGIYAYLGGFNQPEIKQTTAPAFYVAGKAYEGPLKSEAFGKLFQEAGKIVEEKKLSGELGGIYYNNPEDQNDSIRAFVGVLVADSIVALPAGYAIRSFPAGKKVLTGSIKANYMLSPTKVYPALFDYAKNNKLSLQNLFIERFPDTGHLEVTAFLKN